MPYQYVCSYRYAPAHVNVISELSCHKFHISVDCWHQTCSDQSEHVSHNTPEHDSSEENLPLEQLCHRLCIILTPQRVPTHSFSCVRGWVSVQPLAGRLCVHCPSVREGAAAALQTVLDATDLGIPLVFRTPGVSAA